MTVEYFFPQTLSRQLNESRESLQFSNRSCEQLEVKVEELERTNHELQKICDNKQNEIEKRTARIQDLGNKLQTFELEYRTFRDSHIDLKQNGESDHAMVKVARKRSSESNSCETFRGDVPVLPTPAETADLQNTIDTLTLNLKNASYQRQRVEGELKQAMAENQALSKNLDKAEAEINELHKSLKSCEEVFDKQSLENSLRVPVPGVSTPTLISGSHDHYCFTSPGNDGVGSMQSTQRPPKLNECELGASLFSELDTQYTVLQQQYKELLHDCTCSASLSHKHRHRESFEQEETDCATTHSQSVQLDKPFKQLFDEMFATLKQTAQVADRLIERRSYTK